MPAMVSKFSVADGRGKNMGRYNRSRFLGVFACGVCGGWMPDSSVEVVTLSVAGLYCALWVVTLKLLVKPAENRLSS